MPTENGTKLRKRVSARKPRILLLSFEELGVGSSALLAAAALNRNPDLDVRLIYDAAASSSLLRSQLEQIRGLGVKTRSKKDLPMAYLQILFFLLKFRPDVVHELSGSAYRKNLPLWPIFSALSRLVLSEYEPPASRESNFFHRLARRTAYRCGEKFVVFGPASRAALLRYGVDENKIFESRLGQKVFYAETIATRPPRDPNRILFFGSFRPGKGMELLIPIADAVVTRRPQTKFAVIGSSSIQQYYKFWPEQLEALLNQMRARPYFDVQDTFVPEQNVAEYFLRAAAVLLPYQRASQSGVLLTAMTLDCPVIATRVGDIPCVIQHEKNGILCSVDAVAIANEVIALLENPSRAQQLAAQAKQDAENNFSWEILTQKYSREVYGLS